MAFFAHFKLLDLISYLFSLTALGLMGLWIIGIATGMILPRWDARLRWLTQKGGLDAAMLQPLFRSARQASTYILGLPVALGLLGMGVTCLCVVAMPFIVDDRHDMRWVLDVLKTALTLGAPLLLYSALWLLVKTSSIAAGMRIAELMRVRKGQAAPAPSPEDNAKAVADRRPRLRTLALAFVLAAASIAYDQGLRPAWLKLPPLAERVLGLKPASSGLDD